MLFRSSARARLGRAVNTRSTVSAESLGLEVGEEVDFYRTPGSKDASGWYGPATVIDVSRATRNIITIKYQNQVTEVQLQNIRRHLHFWAFLAAPLVQPFHVVTVWDTIAKVTEALPAGTLKQFGAIWSTQGWKASTQDQAHPGWMHAVKFYAENSLHLHPVISARAGRSIKQTPAITGYTRSVICLWKAGRSHTDFIETETDGTGKLDAVRLSRSGETRVSCRYSWAANQ